MAAMICDPELEERLIKERQASGGDRYDELFLSASFFVFSLLCGGATRNKKPSEDKSSKGFGDNGFRV